MINKKTKCFIDGFKWLSIGAVITSFIVAGAIGGNNVYSKTLNITPNVKTSFNEHVKSPVIGEESYIHPQACVIGDVEIGKGVMVSPMASVRGDEGHPIYVGEEANIQDGVILHALETEEEGKEVSKNLYEVDGKKYAIYIGEKVSLAHQAQIHGPSVIMDNSFVGMQVFVFKSKVGKGCVLEPGCKIIGVTIKAGKYVPAGMVVKNQAQADNLPDITAEYAFKDLNKGVLHVNYSLAKAYSKEGKIDNVSPNVLTGFNHVISSPKIDKTAYIHPAASVIGNVYIGKRVMVSPKASIRGDEGQPLYVSDEANVQDGVVLHALETEEEGKEINKNLFIAPDGKKYAVYIGKRVSLAHQSQIHGPAIIGDDTFIAMKAFVFKSKVGKNCVLEPGAKVIGVTIPDGRYVPAGQTITKQNIADALPVIKPGYAFKDTNKGVVHVNTALADGYLKANYRIHGQSVMPNVKTDFNEEVSSPVIDPGAYLHPLSFVIGKVFIGERVMLAPQSSVRGDEGHPIYVGNEANIQDGVILHGLETEEEGKEVEKNLYEVNGKKYSVYVGNRVSLAHQAQIHGPAVVEDDSFIGMQALIFKSRVGNNAVIEPGALVIGVNIPSGRYVSAGDVIISQNQADNLPKITETYAYKNLNKAVLEVNTALADGYNGKVIEKESHQIKKEEVKNENKNTGGITTIIIILILLIIAGGLIFRFRKGGIKMKLKVGTKLIGGFMIVALIAGVIGIVGLISQNSLINAINNLAENNMPSLDALQVMNEAQTAYDGAENALLARNLDNKFREDIYEKFKAIKKRSDDAQKVYEPLPQSVEEAKAWKEFIPAWEKYLKTHDEYVVIAKEFETNPTDANYNKMSDFALKTIAVPYAEAEKLLGKVIEIVKSDGEKENIQSEASAAQSKTILIVVLIIGIVLAVGLGLILTSSIRGPLMKGVDFAKQVAGGDLTAKVEVKSQDELGELAKALTETVGTLRTLMLNITEAADQVAASSEELSTTAQNLSEGSQKQAASLEETSSSMEEMSSSVEQVSEKAQNQASSVEEVTSSMEELSASILGVAQKSKDVKDGAETAVKQAMEAEKSSKEAIDGMKKIEDSSNKIKNIIGVINDIADQTNLLALNASIEAARAGDAGRGFAVVAKEISNLADKSASATKEIEELIRETGVNVENGSEMVKQLDVAIKKMKEAAELATKFGGEMANATEEQLSGSKQITSAIATVNEMAQGIASASEEQSSTAEEMGKTIEGVNQLTQQAASSAEEMSSSTEELSGQAENLKKMVQKFKIN